jgi:uncharacterized damage-inducible protein DinB
MNVGLVDFYKHNLWANVGLLDACAHLTDEQLQTSSFRRARQGHTDVSAIHSCISFARRTATWPD